MPAMKIAALTTVYNEELILPYFLRHYEYCDEIHVLYEIDSTDDTSKILENASNVIVKNVHIDGGLDDIEKANLTNERLHGIKADWVYVVDSDEFIFPPFGSPHDFLRHQDFNVIRAAMFQVYRHRTDKDLDLSLPPVPQRIHGDPDVFSTVEKPNTAANSFYIKPIVVRPSSGIRFAPGNHNVEGNLRISSQFFMGAHWQMADPSIAIARRIQMRERMSSRNKAQSMGRHHWNVTREWIREECERHLDDPIIEALCLTDNNSPSEAALLRNKLFIQEAVTAELKKQLEDRDNQINELNRKVQWLELYLKKITGSITWRVAGKFRNIIDSVMPPNTRMRRIAGRIFFHS